MIYIELEARKDSPVTFGPYTEIVKGGWGDFQGKKPDGTFDDLFEITIGMGGACDTCGYDYVSFSPGKDTKKNDDLFETEMNYVGIRVFFKES